MEIMTDQRFRKTMKYIRAFLFLSLFTAIIMLLFFIGIITYAKILGPPPLAVPQSTLYYANDGSVIGESHNGQKRYWVNLDQINPYLVDATLSIEDQNFYEHNGFDYKRIAGAALADLRAMAKVQGASTISQQYARNLFLEHDKTWKRKLSEAFYTIRLEMNYTKEEIIEGYLNTIYYGYGAYGVQAASQFYFGKDAVDLTLAEASMLAGIPKGPSIYSPLASLEKAEQRQKVILTSMKENGVINDQEAKAAEQQPLTIVGEHPHTKLVNAPYFQDAVIQELKTKLQLDERTIELGGLKVFTTLDLDQQKVAEETIATQISEDSDIQIGFIAMDPKNGYVKALVGGRDYTESSFNRAIQAVRQPGSTIKPLLYYAAFENGFTPASRMRSEQTTFRFDDNRPDYTPKNFNSQYAEDDITMAQALAVSDNIFAVKTHLFLGEETLVETAKRFGITTSMQKVPSLALGTAGVRVIEMANAYSLFANGGKQVTPIMIKRVENQKGEVIYEKKADPEVILRPDLAFVMSQMMTGMFDKKLNGYASVTGSAIINQMTRTYAGKSGSTNSDSWMIGFSPELVSAVWTGYDDGQPIELTRDKRYAKNIWVQFMEKALDGTTAKSFKAPKGTVGVYVDPHNGHLATEDCPVKRFTYFAAGTEPTEYCTDHVSEHEDPSHEKKDPSPDKKEKQSVPWYKKILPWT
ncbi:PBP1A family penicillin-binding protein [Bacillus sp. V3B]|uniref:transglycosylase domain-containing protein n=1 Tax=Bacillus sp. V3B TaxID=2804915 RepID=UPI00210A1D5B|nr:PBP1A family penicillin-binding protein [Bacillus sp. V3B]MCQ6274575.1 PBP1A family penicillin-binding protein [Bacillus sp. V3B]